MENIWQLCYSTLQQHSCPQKEHIDAQDSIFKRGKPYKEGNKEDRLCAGEEKDIGAGETLLVVLAPLYCKRFWKPIDSELNLRHELKKDDIGVCFHPWQEIILPCYPIYLCFKWLILWWNMPFLAHGWRSHAMGFWWHSNDARSLTHSILINLFI